MALEWGQLHVERVSHGPDVFEPADDLPHGEPVVLRRRANGACVFFEPGRGNLCAIQRQMDHAHLPSACRHFPRVVVLDPRGTFVTLSHVCPTAGRMLIDGGPATVVTSGAVIDTHAVGVWEGLDARDALPPLLRAGVLWDWDGWDQWERSAVALLSQDATSPEQALGALRAAVDTVSAWQSDTGALADIVRVIFNDIDRVTRRPLELTTASLTELETLTWQSVPPERGAQPLPPVDHADAPGWDAWHAPIGRYLAARAFANWTGYYGQSLMTWYNSIVAAYALLRLAASRRTTARGAALDAPMLVESFGDADRLLLHLASVPELAANLDDWEAPR
jgi:hypothetical protein